MVGSGARQWVAGGAGVEQGKILPRDQLEAEIHDSVLNCLQRLHGEMWRVQGIKPKSTDIWVSHVKSFPENSPITPSHTVTGSSACKLVSQKLMKLSNDNDHLMAKTS